VFPLSCIGSSFVDFLVASTVLMGLMVYFHHASHWSFGWHPSLLFVPIVLGVQVIMMVGLGMLLAMANLFYRDVRQIFGVSIQLAMFVSAVVVPVPSDGSWLARIIAMNPLVPLISAYRDCILHGRLPEMAGFAYTTVVALVLLAVGWTWFRRASFRFAECI
jgi:lipopolysaccharide transport system permease protein